MLNGEVTIASYVQVIAQVAVFKERDPTHTHTAVFGSHVAEYVIVLPSGSVTQSALIGVIGTTPPLSLTVIFVRFAKADPAGATGATSFTIIVAVFATGVLFPSLTV